MIDIDPKHIPIIILVLALIMAIAGFGEPGTGGWDD